VNTVFTEINDQTLRQLPKVAGAIFPKGTYLYCGSAKGSGGITARVTRHCKQDKKPHWHVDELTLNGAGRVVSVLVVPDWNESKFCDQPQYTDLHVNGFGSNGFEPECEMVIISRIFCLYQANVEFRRRSQRYSLSVWEL
jgi:Uri superfamily endonuclease